MGKENTDVAKVLLHVYEEWLKTPLGQQMKREQKDWIPEEIPRNDLPEGWVLEDGGVEDGYFIYFSEDLALEVSVTEGWSSPCWAGGYPHGHFIGVAVKHEDEDDFRDIKIFLIGEVGWKEAFSQANRRAIEEMKKYG